VAYVAPELREGHGEVEAAVRGRIPELVTHDAIQGLLHVHSTYSDGVASVATLARAAAARGYAYIGITDHSQSSTYARGLTIEQVHAQRDEIDALNAGPAPIPILAGIEADILADGSLDYPPEVLERFDFVIASIHVRHAMSRREMTARILEAIASPHVNILAHPTGRYLLERDGYDVDIDAVMRACVRAGVAIEINCNPHRLDLAWQNIARARELGVLFAINPDAHRPESIDNVRYGIAVARKGWVRAEEVLNVRGLEEARGFFRSRRAG